MSNTLRIKRLTSPGQVPASLDPGEIAINTADTVPTIFVGDESGNPVVANFLVVSASQPLAPREGQFWHEPGIGLKYYYDGKFTEVGGRFLPLAGGMMDDTAVIEFADAPAGTKAIVRIDGGQVRVSKIDNFMMDGGGVAAVPTQDILVAVGQETEKTISISFSQGPLKDKTDVVFDYETDLGVKQVTMSIFPFDTPDTIANRVVNLFGTSELGRPQVGGFYAIKTGQAGLALKLVDGATSWSSFGITIGTAAPVTATPPAPPAQPPTTPPPTEPDEPPPPPDVTPPPPSSDWPIPYDNNAQQLMFHDFNNGQPYPGCQYDNSNDSGLVVQGAPGRQAFEGTHYLRWHPMPGITDPITGLRTKRRYQPIEGIQIYNKIKQGVTKFFVSYYHRYDPKTDYPWYNTQGNKSGWKHSIITGAPAPNWDSTFNVYVGPNWGTNQLRLINNVNVTGWDKVHYAFGGYGPEIDISKNEWHKVEYYIDMGTDGKEDGTFILYMDGVLVSQNYDVPFKSIDPMFGQGLGKITLPSMFGGSLNPAGYFAVDFDYVEIWEGLPNPAVRPVPVPN